MGRMVTGLAGTASFDLPQSPGEKPGMSVFDYCSPLLWDTSFPLPLKGSRNLGRIDSNIMKCFIRFPFLGDFQVKP